MKTEPYNYNHERGMIRPAAWRKVKDAFGAGDVTAQLLFRRLERIANGRTARTHFFAALHAYAMMSPAARATAMLDSFKWDSMVRGHAAKEHAAPPREAPAAEMLGGKRSRRRLLPVEVCGVLYGVRLARKPIRARDGHECDCLVDHCKRIIWVRGDATGYRRVLIIEHARQRAADEVAKFTPNNADDEGRAAA